MAFTPVVGTTGRVRTVTGTVIISGAQQWRINKTCAMIPLNHFELAANTDGIVCQVFASGLATATVTLNGLYDVNAVTKTEGGTPAIRIGIACVVDLLFTRTPFGYIGLNTFCSAFETGANIENQGSNYTATFQITGTFEAAA